MTVGPVGLLVVAGVMFAAGFVASEFRFLQAVDAMKRSNATFAFQIRAVIGVVRPFLPRDARGSLDDLDAACQKLLDRGDP